MDQPPVREGTTATVQVVPWLDHTTGRLVGIVLVKERFSVDPSGRVSRLGNAEIRIADEFWFPDEPETSSIKYPSDLCLRKPSTDVVVAGSAVSPGHQPVRELAVMMRVGPIEKSLSVFGPRAWYGGSVAGMSLTSPEPFDVMPIQWERAFGGSDYETDPQDPIEEPRNPNGLGVVRDADALRGQPGPNIEDPSDRLKTHRSRPKPAGFSPIGRHWAPRRDYAGTYDDEWMEERMPLLPEDFDDRFNQVAPPDQITPQPLQGGERVELLNMHPDGPVAFELPKLRFFVGIQTKDGTLTERPPQLDTLLLEPNDRAFEMTWRAVVPFPRRTADIDFVQVHEKRVLR